LANIKSQIKRNKQNEKRRLRNRAYRGTARIAVRDARFAMDSDNAEESRAAVLKAISALDTAAERGVLHKNNASRRKARLMKRLSAMNVELKSTKEEKAAVEEAPEEKATTKKSRKKSK
jgi:small subunit ribosomal protein S20